MVRLYKSADCSGPVASTGQVAAGTFDIEVGVPNGSSTEFSVTQTDPAGNPSACSSSITYVELDVLTEAEPNGTAASATEHPGGGNRVVAAIQPIGDLDFFAVEVTQPGSSIVAETFGPTGGSCFDIDTFMKLFGPNGTTQLVQDDDDGSGNCSKIDGAVFDPAASNLAPGTYYLSVEEFQNNAEIAGYQLQVDVVPPPNEDEPNNSSASATPLEGNPVRMTGAIDPLADQDWFSITVPEGRSLTTETFDGSGSTCQPSENHDTFVQLYAPDGTTVLASDDDDGTGPCSLISPNSDAGASGLSAGTYFLRVTESGNNGVIPDYWLGVSLGFSPNNEVEPNNTTSQADAATATTPDLLIDSDRRIDASVGAPGDVDVFKASWVGGEIARFETLNASGDDCDPGVTRCSASSAPPEPSSKRTTERHPSLLGPDGRSPCWDQLSPGERNRERCSDPEVSAPQRSPRRRGYRVRAERLDRSSDFRGR